jgi:hypothetical protein
MTIAVEITDRQYDYTDEEKATEAVSKFQEEHSLADAQVIAIWNDQSDIRRHDLEKRIFDAVDLNGTAQRANETVPCGVYLNIVENDA